MDDARAHTATDDPEPTRARTADEPAQELYWAREAAPPASGRIELILGPMFSGKTEELVSRARRAAYAALPVVMVKYRGDRRYEHADVIASHAEVRQASAGPSETQAAIRVVAAETLAEVAACEPVVAVDEGQFYPDLVEHCERWAREGRRVIVAALDGDYARRPFGGVPALLPLCEAVEKRLGVCMVCRRRDAPYSQRISGGGALIEIGARESYRAVCRRCYYDAAQ